MVSLPFKNPIVDEFFTGELVKDFIDLGFSEGKAYVGGYEELEKDMLDKINSAFKFIRLEDFECTKGKNCTWCVYKSLCL